MRAPFVSASGSVERPRARAGAPRGLGRLRRLRRGGAAPDYDGVNVEDVLERARGVSRGSWPRAAGRVPARGCWPSGARMAVLPRRVAAIDMALWDLEGRRAGEPVWRLLGAREAPARSRSTTRSPRPTAPAPPARRARRGRRAFAASRSRSGSATTPAASPRCGRSLGPEVAIRLDANGAWSVEEASPRCACSRRSGSSCARSRCAASTQTRELAAATSVPIALDETRRATGALERPRVPRRVPEDRALRRASPAWCDAARRARARATRCTSPRRSTGRSASRRRCTRPRRRVPTGRAASRRWRCSPTARTRCPPRDGRIEVPDGAGLGDGLDAWYETA